MKTTKLLLITLVCLIVIVYYKYYKSYNDDYNIIQTFLENFNLELLYDKYPIIIYDQIVDPLSLTKTIFAYSYVFKKQNVIQPSLCYPNNSKFALIWNETNDSQIDIINPKYKKYLNNKTLQEADEVQYISIKLKPHQILIIPSLWIIHSNSPMEILQFDDIISKFVLVL